MRELQQEGQREETSGLSVRGGGGGGDPMVRGRRAWAPYV